MSFEEQVKKYFRPGSEITNMDGERMTVLTPYQSCEHCGTSIVVVSTSDGVCVEEIVAWEEATVDGRRGWKVTTGIHTAELCQAARG
jgi:hypothetical protein